MDIICQVLRDPGSSTYVWCSVSKPTVQPSAMVDRCFAALSTMEAIGTLGIHTGPLTNIEHGRKDNICLS